MSEYHFGLSGVSVWLGHILLAIYFIYLGYKLNSSIEFKNHGLVIVSMGVLMLSYHGHLWLVESKEH